MYSNYRSIHNIVRIVDSLDSNEIYYLYETIE